MTDLTHVRTRRGADPHFVNVDLYDNEIGYLELNCYGEVVTAEVHDRGNAKHRGIIAEVHRLVAPVGLAAVSCAVPRR
ncbi:hypothetical protein [Kribbella sp. NPDC049584]|uniref:hypothetical protein n=1 Tax=Kribbella sp. NPDC049584 TaxID=3154833 RepID=UPI0034199BE4